MAAHSALCSATAKALADGDLRVGGAVGAELLAPAGAGTDERERREKKNWREEERWARRAMIVAADILKKLSVHRKR